MDVVYKVGLEQLGDVWSTSGLRLLVFAPNSEASLLDEYVLPAAYPCSRIQNIR